MSQWPPSPEAATQDACGAKAEAGALAGAGGTGGGRARTAQALPMHEDSLAKGDSTGALGPVPHLIEKLRNLLLYLLSNIYWTPIKRQGTETGTRKIEIKPLPLSSQWAQWGKAGPHSLLVCDQVQRALRGRDLGTWLRQ